MAVEDPEERPRHAVADPEEYNQTQRLRAVNQARQRVEDTIEQSMVRLVTDPEFQEADRQQVIRAALYSYLTNIEWLMDDAENRKLLSEQSLGTVTIHPPAEFVQWLKQGDRGYPRVIGADSIEPWTKEIVGIRGYLTAPEVFEHTWRLQVQKRHERPQPVERTKQTYMPAHISMNAFRMSNRFLSQAGIDIDLKEDEHRAVVDEEVLKEVEEWRKQHNL